MKAVHTPTEDAWGRAVEDLADTDYPVVVDDDGEVVAVVLIYGAEGLEKAEKVAEALTESRGGEHMISTERIETIRAGLTDALEEATQLQDGIDEGIEVEGLDHEAVHKIRCLADEALRLLPK